MWIGHSNMSKNGHFMEKEVLTLCKTFEVTSYSQVLLYIIHCQIHIEIRKSLEIQDKIYEPLDWKKNKSNKTIISSKFNSTYNLI